MMEKRGGKRYSALIEFRGEARIVNDLRAHDVEHAKRLVEWRRDTFFRLNQVPVFQQKTYRVVGLFHGGALKFAQE
jgi:hypothetical protein